MSSSEIFKLYIDYLLFGLSQSTATRLSELTGGLVSHDKITRSLNEAEYGPQDLWKEIKPLVRKIESEDGVIIFDDSILEKEYTDENEMISWHFDHSKNQNVKGINLVTGLYFNKGISVPVSYYLVKKTEKYIDKKTGKEKRRSPISKNEMVRDMADKIVENHVKFKFFLLDSWFSASENMMYFKVKLNKDFIMAVKSNRTIALSLEDKKKRKYQSLESVNLENNSVIEVYLEGVNFPLLLNKQIFTNKDGSSGILYLMTSNTGLSSDDMKLIYQKRWKIEEYHKSLKQNTSITKSPTQTILTQSNHIFASLCAFCKLEKLKIVKNQNHFSLKKLITINAQKLIMSTIHKLSANLNSEVNLSMTFA